MTMWAATAYWNCIGTNGMRVREVVLAYPAGILYSIKKHRHIAKNNPEIFRYLTVFIIISPFRFILNSFYHYFHNISINKSDTVLESRRYFKIFLRVWTQNSPEILSYPYVKGGTHPWCHLGGSVFQIFSEDFGNKAIKFSMLFSYLPISSGNLTVISNGVLLLSGTDYCCFISWRCRLNRIIFRKPY
jgi:hypothetical protein